MLNASDQLVNNSSPVYYFIQTLLYSIRVLSSIRTVRCNKLKTEGIGNSV